MQISAVILTKNNADTIGLCLSSLMPYYVRYLKEIIVVDGYSKDGTINIVKKYPVKLVFDNCKGIGSARNIGWKNAEGDIIFFIDSDAYIVDNLFPTLLKLFNNKNIGGVGCGVKSVVKNKIMKTVSQWQSRHYLNLEKIICRNRFNLYLDIMGFPQKIGLNQLIIGITGPCYAIRRSCLESVGGFGEEHAIAGEELCLSRKIIERGWKTCWLFDAPIYHHPKSTIKDLVKEHVGWGKGDCIAILERSKNTFEKITRVFVSTFPRLLAPMLGIQFAIRYKNLLHIILFPLVQYSWIIGCFLKLLKM